MAKKIYFQPEVMVSRMATTGMIMAGSGGESTQGTPISGDPNDAI